MRTEQALNLSTGAPGPLLDRVVDGHKAWVRGSLSPDDWTLSIPPQALAEIAELVETLRRAPLPLLMLEPGMFSLPACRDLMGQVRELLQSGIGLCVVERLPLDALSSDEAKAVYWTLGLLLGRTVVQKWDGTMLYDG